jgi:hypothetical protein
MRIINNNTGKIDGGLVAALLALGAFAAGFAGYVLLDRVSHSGNKVPADYRYPIEELAKIDPAKILYRQVGPAIETGLKSTTAIEMDRAGNFYIAGDQAVAVFAGDGQKLREISLASEPTALAVGENGLIYVGLTDRIEVYSAEGQVVSAWAPARTALLTAIAVGKNDVFAADALNKVVRRYDKQGNPLQIIGAKDADRNIEGIVVPSPYFDLLIAPDGLLRVVNPGRHRIEAYTFDGHLEWTWGKPSSGLEGFSGCCNPIALALLPDGGFVTCEKGLVRVKAHDEEGGLIGVVAGPDQLGWQAPLRVCEKPEDCQARGLDIAVDAQGRIYVLNQVRNIVRIFEKK